MKKISAKFLLCFFFIGFFAPSNFSQSTTGRIEGTVKDTSGAIIPNAAVTVTDTRTNLQRTATTNDNGSFAIAEMPSGEYNVRVEAANFRVTSINNVIVEVATTATVNVELTAGNISETVEIAAEDAQEAINTTNAEIGDVVNRRRVLDLPLDGRNPLDLIVLQAGASDTGRVNGNRARGLNITVNGMNASDNFNKSEENIISNPTVPVSVESVREFRVTTGLATAEFGRGSAQVNVISQSGGNDYRGSLFWFHRNSALNANNFFNNRTIDINTGKSIPREFLIRNQYGGRFGGPLILPRFGEGVPYFYNGKNRTFFFVSYEGTRLAASESVNRYSLTEEARKGNYRYLNGLQTTPANVLANPSLIRTVNVLNINSRRTNFDPTVMSYLGLTYAPNNFDIGDGLNVGGYRFNARRSAPKDIYTLRLDHRFNDKYSWEFNYSYGNDFQYGDYVNGRIEPFPGQSGVDRLTRSRSVSTALQMNLSSQTVNEFRFGFVNPGTTFDNVNFNPPYLIYLGYSSRIPLNDPYRLTSPNARKIPVTQFIDNFTHVRGNHLLKAGFDIRLLRGKVYSFNDALPAVNFNATDNDPGFTSANFPGIVTTSLTSANAAEYLANILTGAIGSIEQTFNADSPEEGFVPGAPLHRNYATEEFDFYVQDTWKARSNLTLNFGLRYEYSTPPRDRDNLVVLPVGGKQGIYGPTSVDALFTPGNATNPRTTNDFVKDSTFFKPDRNNFAPVVSFAWSPFKNNKTSLRAGYRMSYIRENFNLYENILRGNSGLTIYNDYVVGNRFLRDGVPTVPTPTFTLPVSMRELFQRSASVNIFGVDENLETPMMQEWSASIEREIFKDTVLEARYVGNVSNNLIRVYDINEVNVFAVDSVSGQSFLQAFNTARANLAAGRNITVNNPLFARIFSGAGASSATSSTFTTPISRGEVGEVADLISRTSIGGVRGGLLFNSGLPINFFRANPDAYGAFIAENGSRSSFHALQLELRRRFRQGLSFQVNYQFGKELADFTGTTTNQSAFVTLRDKDYEYRIQSPLHQVKANFIYELPFGKNKTFFNKSGITDAILGGWQIGGIMRWESGTPLSIYSAYGTLNTAARSGLNTVDNTSGKTVEQLRAETGVQTIGNLLYYFDPNAFKANFANPQPGTLGNLSQHAIIGPRYFRTDLSAIKRTSITETQNIEFRAEFFNAFNNVNFRDPNTNFNSANFGIISQIRGQPRVLQFALRYNF